MDKMYNMNRMVRIFTVRYSIIMALVLTIAAGLNLAQTADSSSPQLISESARPLAEAAVILQGEYGKPVTYEDPILMWPGDTDQVQYIRGGTGLVPKRRSFSMPAEANPNKSPVLDTELLREVVNAYNTQTDGPRFKVSASHWGLHIIPDQVKNSRGQFVNATSLLDTIITIPRATRTPSAHFDAICKAITAATPTGIELKPNDQWMNQYFSEERRLPRILNEEQKAQLSFDWGTTDTVAREAVISLLEHSATTMTWKVLCQPDEGFCVFNLQPVLVDVKNPDGTLRGRKALSRDRIK
jgi:hypothetical protein